MGCILNFDQFLGKDFLFKMIKTWPEVRSFFFIENLKSKRRTRKLGQTISIERGQTWTKKGTVERWALEEFESLDRGKYSKVTRK